MYAHNLYDPLQSAYRAKHATETAIIKLNNDIIRGMDEGKCTITSGVSRISFRGGGGGFRMFLEKWGYLHGATRFLGGFGSMLPRENF